MALARGSGSRLAVQTFNLPNGDTVDVSTNDQEEAAVFLGFGYTVSTAIVPVSTSNYLYAELANPSGSGVNLVMTSRVMMANLAEGATPVEYVRYVPTATLSATPTPTSVTVNNRISSGAASTATFRYAMGATPPTGASTAGGFIPNGGIEKRIKEQVLIPPGGKLIYAIGGAGGGLSAAARVAITFLFYTQPI